MGHNISACLLIGDPNTSTFVVPAGSTVNLDIDLSDISNATGLIEVTYAATASTTGIAASAFYGFGPQDSSLNANLPIPCAKGAAYANGGTVVHGTNIPRWSTNSDSISMDTITAGQSSQQFAATFFIITIAQNSRWLELRLVNNDLTNNATIRVYINSGV